MQDYGLYPGTDDKPGLKIVFQPGVTLVIGANGLGKSTLVAIVLRTLTGPNDISGVGLGQLSLRSLRQDEIQTFGPRVADSAADAHVSLQFSLGETTIVVERRLQNLRLTRLVVNDLELDATESNYQDEVIRGTGLATFLDWLMVLKYLVFYGDDRRSLVWDATAQRRMLRMLFLPGNEVEPNSDLVNRILQQDSYYRNVSATLSRQERTLSTQEKAVGKRPELQRRLDETTTQIASAVERLEAEREVAADLINARNSARLTALRAAETLQDRGTRLEQLRLSQVRATFPTQSETSAYWLTQLAAESRCIVCGTDTVDYRTEILTRIGNGHCPACNSPAQEFTTPPADELVALEQEYADAAAALEFSDVNRADTEAQLKKNIVRVAELEDALATLTREAERLEASLPDSDRSISERRDALRTLRVENEQIREQVIADKEEYARLVNEQNLFISEYQERIKEKFDEYAHDFLAETISLVWGSIQAQIGQLGQPIRFSVFQVDMTSGSTGSTRRESASQVSESQREFIDIAFRMALVTLASENGGSTIVMDAPESSLDAVFAPRAAQVLTKFAPSDGQSRMILTSNLIDGQLIPTIGELAGIEGPGDERVLNLFEVAAPTAAVQQWSDDYAKAMQRAFRRPGADD